MLALFVISEQDLKLHDAAAVKVDFMLRNLSSLAASLESLRIPLLIKAFSTRSAIPQQLLALCQQHSVKHVCFNIEYEVDEARRDRTLTELCEQSGIAVHSYHDQCIIPPNTVHTKEGKTYTVFSPFKNAWYKRMTDAPSLLTVHPAPEALTANPLLDTAKSDPIPTSVPGFPAPAKAIMDMWPAGEGHAHRLLDQFAVKRIYSYDDQRNFPAVDGTSALSPYLALGVISARQCLSKARDVNKGYINSGSPGVICWISELCWRDFYRHILQAFPRVCMNRAFKEDMDKVAWRYDDSEFKRWCEGRTGYPIVDAAMRQLNQTGWMHNRLRMVVAMFLTKHLMIDWRWGERYFMQHLVDGDFASNNGGWQWSSSTGTDAQPYFRIFNPTSQSTKFDASGTFIKKYVPELAPLSATDIHEPWAKVPAAKLAQLGYCQPMVEHTKARERCLTAFKSLKKTTED